MAGPDSVSGGQTSINPSLLTGVDGSLIAGGSSAAPAVGGSATVGSIKSMDDLKNKAKPIYDAILNAWIIQFKDSQDRSNERIKQILNESKQSK